MNRSNMADSTEEVSIFFLQSNYLMMLFVILSFQSCSLWMNLLPQCVILYNVSDDRLTLGKKSFITAASVNSVEHK